MAAIMIGVACMCSSSAAAGWYAWTNNVFSTSNYTSNITSSNTTPDSNTSTFGGSQPAQMLTDMSSGSSMLAPMTTDSPSPMMRSDIGTSLSPSDNPTGISAGQPITVTLRCGGSV